MTITHYLTNSVSQPGSFLERCGLVARGRLGVGELDLGGLSLLLSAGVVLGAGMVRKPSDWGGGKGIIDQLSNFDQVDLDTVL